MRGGAPGPEPGAGLVQPLTQTVLMRSADRPLSPHLQIYRPQLTSVLSILHRASGVARFLGSWIGLVLLFGWTAALAYHLCNGLRHLVWDTAHALDLKSTYVGGWAVVAAAAALTVATWAVGIGSWGH